ncbi:E3 ubiquitin-protein ligase hrd1 [Scheffersomyces spartinae]|uniref:E3 ubiquitin-protein ligase hrd1 n=1 Tax=Scheffersomyces spartinae TaxID=45513 RepID=A0A9P8AID6_9ASCO|nr:E3 ubiquitin-protein ligase hrd1 [Scheffersomyces spartinae]KAG7193620.1 E3 ubiquitin-protein ligase hrd1 [Scheffersomyces spartinae]
MYDLFTTRILNNLHEYTSRKQVALAFVVNPNFWISVLLTAFEYVAGAVLLYDIDEYQKLTLITFGFHFVLMTILSLAKVAKLLVMLHETTWYYTPSRNTEDQDFELDGVNAEAEVDDENEAEVDDENEAEVDDENDELIWEAKTYYVKGIKITASFLELMANCRMMYLLYVFTKEFPLTCLGGIFFSLKAILKEIIHLRKYIIAANALETSIQNASKEDLAQGDNSCIVCFEIMFSVEEYDRKHSHKPLTKRRYPKKLLCGHILHMGCLKQWLERSDSCPMCRRKVMIGEAVDTTASPPPQAQAQAQAQPVERPMAPQPTQQEPETNNSNEIVTITTTPPDPESIPNLAVDDKTILLTSTRTSPVDPLVVRVNLNLFLPKHWMALPLRRLNGTTTTTYEIQGTSGAFLQTNGDENNDP